MPQTSQTSHPDRDVTAMTHIGRRITEGLLARRRGCRVGFDGWSAALQLAADLTHDHREVLRIADEIHATAGLLATRAMIRFYARSASSTVEACSVQALLTGMVLEVDDPSHQC